MRYLLYSVTIFACHIAYGWHVHPDVLREKCAAETPEWMSQQIENDLYSLVNTKMIDSTLATICNTKAGSVSELVKIQIQEGKISWLSPFTLSTRAQERLLAFIASLNLLQEIVPLPDIEFLLSLANHYDRPLFSLFAKAPVFTVCKEKCFSQAILFPNRLWMQDWEKPNATISWEERIPSAFWRGSASELYDVYYWDFNGRPRLVFFSRANPDLLDAAFIDNNYIKAMDWVWQHWIRENGLIKPYVPTQDQLQHRYLVAIDGDSAPVSLTWQLFSGSAILKSDSTRVEWFYEGLEPYVHYLPFNPNRSDLIERITWLREHDDLARIMATKAKEFAEERLTDENALLYTYKLLQAYSQLFIRGSNE